MAIPISQVWTVATYVWKQKLKGNKRYPLVLMLEPLFRCNLACAGCGKVQYPPHILKKQLSPEECFAAVEESGVPMVSIPGGEPLLHPQIVEIVNGLIARKKYIYLCTNALELKRRLPEFTPSKYLTFSVHLDGQREHHDFSVCREGGWDIAVEGIKEAVKRGFRVTPNSTFFDGVDPNSVRAYFDEVMAMGVEGIVLSPGYSYDKAPDQSHFMGRAKVRRLFRAIVEPQKELEVQHVAAVPRVPDGRPQLRVHAVGLAFVQHLRMAKALLPSAGWLRRHVQGTDRNHQVGRVRRGQRKSQMRQLHGELRIRTDRGDRWLPELARFLGHGQGQFQRLQRRARTEGAE
jgi:hopanoid biosynthesis associated radical SAM protein HpnH